MIIFYIIKQEIELKNIIFPLAWIFSYLIVYGMFLKIATPGNNYYLIAFLPPLCILAALVVEKLKRPMVISIIIISLLISCLSLYVIYDTQYPYKEAGAKINSILSKDEAFIRVYNPAVCFYAKRYCRVPPGDLSVDISNTSFRYLSIDKDMYENYVLTDPKLKDYISENFDQIFNITGKVNIMSGASLKIKKFPEYELLYRRK
jgi:hypothetical protein